MSFARAMSRGAFLKARLGVNGSQNGSRSFGAVAVTAVVLAGDMGASMTGGGYRVRRDLARIGRSRLARRDTWPRGGVRERERRVATNPPSPGAGSRRRRLAAWWPAPRRRWPHRARL